MNLLLQPAEAVKPARRRALSSLTGKYLMAVTGLGLMIFVLAHLSGNLLIYSGKDAINAYAHALADKPALVWTTRVVLGVIFVVHIAVGTWCWLQDRKARGPVRYVYEKSIQASWASRHMLLTGLVVLAFVVYHLLHFTAGVTEPGHFKTHLALHNGYLDVAEMEVLGFSQWPVAVGYIVAQVFLGLHLWHGAWSWLHHLGLDNRGYYVFFRWFGMAFALVIALGNISIPLAILAGWRPL